MNLAPRKLPGVALGSLLLALLLMAAGVSVARLGQSSISPQSLIWIGLLLLALPLMLLVFNRLFGLVTARYRLDRDGFYVQWGLAYEQVPISSIQGILTGADIAGLSRPDLGFWWPGCMVGRTELQNIGQIEFFASYGPLVVITTDSARALAISPPDPEAFVAGFNNARRMGALEQIPARSDRPARLISDIRSDRLASILILLGLTIPLVLLGALVIGAQTLPDEVPFGFAPDGQPGPLVPPGRLILLPVIGGLIWLADLLLGSWFYRIRRDRPIARVLWGAAVMSGLLLVGATLQLVSR
jgi:hypothetical protein